MDKEALEVSRVECEELCRQLCETQEQLTGVEAQLASAQQAPSPSVMPGTTLSHTLLQCLDAFRDSGPPDEHPMMPIRQSDHPYV